MKITVFRYWDAFAQESILEIAISEKEAEAIKSKYEDQRGIHLTHSKTREV